MLTFFDDFSSRFRSFPASNGLQRPPVTSVSRGRLRIDWILLGFRQRLGFFRSTYGAFFHVTFSSGLECFVGFFFDLECFVGFAGLLLWLRHIAEGVIPI